MALFVVAGVLSLTAGLGIGALVGPHSPEVVVVVEEPNHAMPVQPPKIKKVPPGKAAQLPPAPNLDFTTFDEQLVSLMNNKKQLQGGGGKSSHLRASVVYDKEYYTPVLHHHQQQQQQQQQQPVRSNENQTKKPTSVSSVYGVSWF